MAIYNETASMDGSKLLKKFKEEVSMENIMVCNIQAKCKYAIGGEADVFISSNSRQHDNKHQSLLDQTLDVD